MSKDSFGDKLRDKEKAEEDRYFREQDKEKLAKLKSGEQQAQLGLCPKCGTALEARSVDGLEIDACDACGGLWLDKGELEQVVERENEGWATRWVRSLLAGK